jgi:hypothetical protein
MVSLNFLYYSLGIGFLILVGFLCYAAFSFSKGLKDITSILDKIDDVVKDADELKNFIKSGVLNLINMFLKKKQSAKRAADSKGGEKDDK